MKKSKYRIILPLVALCPFLILFILVLVLVLVLNHGHVWKYSADFEKYSTDFIKVKDYVSEQYSEDYGKWFFVSITDEQGSTLYDPDTNNTVELPDEVRKSLENIDDFGFPDKDANLYTIRVHGERVTFAIEAGNYALVYSPNEKPTWLHSPDEDNDVKVRKIGDGWYHVLVVIN